MRTARSVSSSRSSNRTGGFPASGFRTRHHAFAHGKLRVRNPPSLRRAAPPGASGPFLEVLGSCHSPRSSLLPALALNHGPFPPPALPGFIGTTGQSATPRGPVCPSRASGWRSHAATAWGFPCFVDPLRVRAVASTPAGSSGHLSLIPPAMAAFPVIGRVGSRIILFEACSAFTHVTARTLAEPLNDSFTSEAPVDSLPPPPLRLLPAGATLCRAGLSPAEDQRLFTAHR